MTARGLLRQRFDERRRQARADVDRERAARDEAAAFRGIDRRGRATSARVDPLGLELLGRIGDGREQEARVRVKRRLEHLLDRPALDDLAGVQYGGGGGGGAGGPSAGGGGRVRRRRR